MYMCVCVYIYIYIYIYLYALRVDMRFSVFCRPARSCVRLQGSHGMPGGRLMSDESASGEQE